MVYILFEGQNTWRCTPQTPRFSLDYCFFGRALRSFKIYISKPSGIEGRLTKLSCRMDFFAWETRVSRSPAKLDLYTYNITKEGGELRTFIKTFMHGRQKNVWLWIHDSRFDCLEPHTFLTAASACGESAGPLPPRPKQLEVFLKRQSFEFKM